MRRGQQRPRLVVERGARSGVGSGNTTRRPTAATRYSRAWPSTCSGSIMRARCSFAQRLAVGQRQVGRPEHDEVGVERHRLALAEGELAGGRAAVVREPAGQAAGRGVGPARSSPMRSSSSTTSPRPLAGPLDHGVDRLGQRGALLAVGRAAGQQGQEPEGDRDPLVAAEAAQRVEAAPRRPASRRTTWTRPGTDRGERDVLAAGGAVDGDHLAAPGQGVPAQALEEERLARPQAPDRRQRRAGVRPRAVGGVEQHRGGGAAVERDAEQQAGGVADLGPAERAAGRQVAGQHELGVVAAHRRRRRCPAAWSAAGRAGRRWAGPSPYSWGSNMAGSAPAWSSSSARSVAAIDSRIGGLQLGLGRVGGQLGPLVVDGLDGLGQLGRRAGDLAVVLVDLAHQVAVLAPHLGLGLGVGDRPDPHAPVDGEADVVGVVEPLAAAAGEAEVVGHVGQRQHGLVARCRRAVDPDVAAVAGPVLVVAGSRPPSRRRR